MSMDSYSIYQVKEGPEQWGVRFEPLERLQAAGGRVDRANYDLLYSGPLDQPGTVPDAKILAALYFEFNVNHPPDFAGRSLSISDVVVLRRNYELSAHYVDSGTGFAKVPEFFDGPYRYYATQRPVDIGTFPKTDFGPVHMESYGSRIPVEDGRYEAWGHLEYSGWLTGEQIRDYELQPSIANPDLYRYPPRQLDAQLQVVGQWEAAQNIPEAKRFVEWNADAGKFELRRPELRIPANARYKRITEQPPTIEQRLAQAKREADRENATRPAPAKEKDKDSR